MNLPRENPIASGTVNQQLDTEIIDYMPEALQSRFRNKLNGLTLRRLSLHRSGLRREPRRASNSPHRAQL